jgi:hypothetical protein
MFRTVLCLSLSLATLPLAAADFPLSTPGTSVRQWGARSAAGAGLDLVVWEERSLEKVALKASRIGPVGAPLDGEGIVIADDGLIPDPFAVADFAVAFDGEAFVVAWKRDEGLKESLLVRTVSPAGDVSEPRVIVSWDAIGALRVAGGGEGRSAISWFGRDATFIPPGGTYLAALVRGEGGTPVQLAPLFFSSATGLAAGPNGYLAVFIRPLPCQITCVPAGPLYARSFGFDGTPTSEPRLLDTDDGNGPAILSNGESFFVAWGASVLEVDDAVNVASAAKLARSGWASLDGDEIRIDTGIHRAVYSPSGLLRRFEPLMLQRYEIYAGTISGKRALVLTGPESARRLVVRSLETASAADLAIVATGALLPSDRYSYERLVVFRIEHRGGAPVKRIAFWWEREWRTVTIPGEISYQGGTVLDRTLREGESFEVAVPIHESFMTDDLWIAGDVVDSQPWNNVDTYAPPDRRRGRTVSR